MELLQLKYFETVAKYENMTAASTELCVTQPAVSQSVTRLEDELGVQLFIRQGKRLKLSPCGRLLYSRIPSVLNTLDNLQIELIELANTPIQHICLNVLSASTLLPRLLSEFRVQYPQISFSLTQNPKETNYDLCITSAPSAEKLAGTVLLDEEILLAVPQSSPKACRSLVSLFDLNGEDFVSLSKGTAFRNITDFYCNQIGFTPKINYESDNPGTVRGLIGAGIAVAFWPAVSWGPLKEDSVTALHISDMNLRRVTTIAPPDGKQLSRTSQLFVSFTTAFFKSL